MSGPTRVKYNTLEQTISADFNRTGVLAGRGAQDVALGLLGGISGTPPDVVRQGLVATTGAGLSVDVSAGELLRYDSATLITDDASRYKLGRLYTTTNCVIGANATGNPRIDLISAVETSTDADSENRNILALPARTVSLQAVNVTNEPTMGLLVTAGTAGASPAFPATPAGRVPLWYVWVPTGAASITDNFILDARIYYYPASARAQNTIDSGLHIGSSDGTNIIITSGYGLLSGGPILLTADRTFTNAAAVLAPGHAGLAASTVYHLYCAAVGSGNPIAKGVSGGIVFSLSTTAPDANGTASIPYNPMQGLAPTGGSRTATMLYVGSIRSNASSLFESTGIRLNRNSTRWDPNVNPIANAFPGSGTGWIRKPTFVDTGTGSSVTVGTGYLVLGGRIISLASSTPTMASNLATGVIEAADTWYYVYVRLASATNTYAPVRDTVMRISDSPPTAAGNITTPEAGFASTDYLFVGSVYNDAGSDFTGFYRRGNVYTFATAADTDFRLHNTTVSELPTVDTLTALVPASSTMARISVELRAAITSDGGSTVFYVHENALPVPAVSTTVAVGLTGGGAGASRMFWVQDVSLDVDEFGISRDALVGTGMALVAVVWQLGYIEDLDQLE